MFDSQYWPQLSMLLKYDKVPYVILSPLLLEEQCAVGDRSLVGHGLFSVRLDMALAGLMAELGEDFFLSDIFPSRLTAVAEITAAARVFLSSPADDPRENDPRQEYRVRQLAEEAHDVLRQWAQFASAGNQPSLLKAAEEAAELF